MKKHTLRITVDAGFPGPDPDDILRFLREFLHDFDVPVLQASYGGVYNTRPLLVFEWILDPVAATSDSNARWDGLYYTLRLRVHDKFKGQISIPKFSIISELTLTESMYATDAE